MSSAALNDLSMDPLPGRRDTSSMLFPIVVGIFKALEETLLFFELQIQLLDGL